MSDTPRPPAPPAEPRIERYRPWLAALLSALLHGLMLAILLFYAAKPIVTSPQGSSSGGRVKVDFVGESNPPPPSPPPSPPPMPPSRAIPRELVDPRRLLLPAEPVQPPDTPPEQTATRPPQPATAPPSPSSQRRPETWTGRPPGMLEEDIADADDGSSIGRSNRQGRANDPDADEPSMEVGGYQIVYDLLGEERLRGWIEQGMKEVSIPLPGTRYRMVCPAEVALRRGSSKCRLLDPGDPEMQAIGDARQVITVMYVYRRGELVWRGPGPYR